MEKNVLFSIPLFCGAKKQKTFIYNNFRQALQGIIDEQLLYIEHYADMNFYIDGCQKVTKTKPKRIYFAEVKSYKELWYRAVNDKWLNVPENFMYDKKYQYKRFLFSKRAREIAEFPSTEFIALQDKYYDALLGKKTIMFVGEGQNINNSFPVQQDVECCLGDGVYFTTLSPNKDFYSVLKAIKQQRPKFIGISLDIIQYKFDATTKRQNSITIYAEEDKITAQEALKKTKNSLRISRAIERGEQFFAYNPQKKLITSGFNAVFVPRKVILNEWKF